MGPVESVAVRMEIGPGRDAEQLGHAGGCWGRGRLDSAPSDRSRWRKIPSGIFFREDVQEEPLNCPTAARNSREVSRSTATGEE